MSEPIPVPRAALDGIEAVRRSGRTNMLDRPAVARVAHATTRASTRAEPQAPED